MGFQRNARAAVPIRRSSPPVEKLGVCIGRVILSQGEKALKTTAPPQLCIAARLPCASYDCACLEMQDGRTAGAGAAQESSAKRLCFVLQIIDLTTLLAMLCKLASPTPNRARRADWRSDRLGTRLGQWPTRTALAFWPVGNAGTHALGLRTTGARTRQFERFACPPRNPRLGIAAILTLPPQSIGGMVRAHDTSASRSAALQVR